MKFTLTAALAALGTAGASGAPLGGDAAIAHTVERRGFFDDSCVFKKCANGKRDRRWWKKWDCICNEGFAGRCCDKCDVPAIQTVDIELGEWTRATWFVQRQQENGFQKKEDLFCVAATYGLSRKKVPFFKGTVIDVSNYANSNKVNGEAAGGPLCGRVSDEPGKLSVAPCFLPNVAAGPYWIMGLGVDADHKYEWAVIIGGEPKEFGKETGKCTTSIDKINNSGLWFFTRNQIATAEQLAAMEAVIDRAGVSGSKMFDVVQKGCKYEGANIKA